MYNGFIFDKKGVFYILTAISSFAENVSINFEHKNVKSLIMLLGSLVLSAPILQPRIYHFCGDEYFDDTTAKGFLGSRLS